MKGESLTTAIDIKKPGPVIEIRPGLLFIIKGLHVSAFHHKKGAAGKYKTGVNLA